MKLIKSITDKCFIDSEISSSVNPRLTARSILRNKDGHIGLIYISKFLVYCFPGGKIEEGESIEDALKREILEETGCTCKITSELGYIYENRGTLDYVQKSFYYVTDLVGEQTKGNLTETEINNGTCFNWYSKTEIYDRLMSSAHETLQQKFLQARDLAVYEEYLNQEGL